MSSSESDIEAYTCERCGVTEDKDEIHCWFLDNNYYNEKRGDLCYECRAKGREIHNPYGMVRCDRCYELQGWMRFDGKWPISDGVLECCYCEGNFCEECHGIIHRNK